MSFRKIEAKQRTNEHQAVTGRRKTSRGNFCREMAGPQGRRTEKTTIVYPVFGESRLARKQIWCTESAETPRGKAPKPQNLRLIRKLML